jgi:hypothetical protein
MKLHILAALIASTVLALPAEAASGKKHKRTLHHATSGAIQPQGDPNDVYVGNVLTGRDPDPNIRAYLRRSPAPWDGPD